MWNETFGGVFILALTIEALVLLIPLLLGRTSVGFYATCFQAIVVLTVAILVWSVTAGLHPDAKFALTLLVILNVIPGAWLTHLDRQRSPHKYPH